jgi:hypothetical protein
VADIYGEIVALAEALEACRKLKDRAGRQQVIGVLPDEIANRIDQYDDTRSHIISIVQACAEIAGGVDLLIGRLKVFDGVTTAWGEVERTAGLLKAKLALAPPLAPDVAIEPAGPADLRNLALVIGISKYEHGALADHELKPEQFTDLSYAADDAVAVHRSLQDHAGYLMQPPLVNQDATRRGILHAIDELRRQCRNRKQTVVIYFSGHGASDADGRHYLVPFDARRDDLFATALWSALFERALQEIQTERLVVFLDACHAGAIGAAGAKDAELARFDPQGLKAMTPELGRFMVASCQARQRSLEADGHGIFTQHLLELLESEDPGVFPDVEVDLFDLYSALRTRVNRTAIARFRGVQQDPFANFRERTGVVLRVQIERKRRYLEALLGCLAPEAGQPARIQHNQRLRIENRLRSYVKGGERNSVLEKFYLCFDEGLRRTNPDNIAAVEEDCRDLVDYFDQAMASKTQPPPQGSPRAPSPPRPPGAPDSGPVDPRPDWQPAAPAMRAVPAPDQTASTAVLGGAMQAPPLALSQEDRRLLDDADCTYVLNDILQDPRLFREAALLRQLLARADGVSPQDISRWLIDAAPKVSLHGWEEMSLQIADRFMERFPSGRKVTRVRPVDLRTSRGN